MNKISDLIILILSILERKFVQETNGDHGAEEKVFFGISKG